MTDRSAILSIEPIDDWALVQIDDGAGGIIEYEVRLAGGDD